MSSENQSSYRQIFKATSLFGGVQVVTIIVSIVRNKIIAILLGTTGVGILGLLNAPIGLITSITGFGILYSAVRDISEANSSGDEQRLSRMLISFRRWVIFTGLLGMGVTIILSSWLSKWTFSSSNFVWSFTFLSVTLLLNAMSGGQKAILQGTRRLKSMAKATILGSVFGLCSSIPLYYFYGIRGIVPSLIISAVVTVLISGYYTSKISFSKHIISYKESFYAGIRMIKLGIILTISIQIGTLVTYLLNLFISHSGGVVQVGLYTSGMNLIGSSVGLVFTAMGIDYYPKLAGISTDNNKIVVLVNQQAIMSILILLPLVLILLLTMPILIRLFLSKDFIAIIPFVNLMVLGIIIKAVSYAIGYISFAKGDSKVFFWLEGIMSNILTLVGSMVGYKYFGLIGIGFALVANYVIYLFIAYLIVQKRYSFFFSKELYLVLLKSSLICTLSYLSIRYLSIYPKYIVLFILLVISLLYSFHELNQRMNLKPEIMGYLKRFLNVKSKPQ
jgi:O-antigen/teichoic acid export membrane protein